MTKSEIFKPFLGGQMMNRSDLTGAYYLGKITKISVQITYQADEEDWTGLRVSFEWRFSVSADGEVTRLELEDEEELEGSWDGFSFTRKESEKESYIEGSNCYLGETIYIFGPESKLCEDETGLEARIRMKSLI